jgi:hypothetical protein
MDPPPDKEFPATMEAPDILSHGSRLNAVAVHGFLQGTAPHNPVEWTDSQARKKN